MRSIPENLISSITVKRPIQHTTTTVEQPQYDYEEYSSALPFYYCISPCLGCLLIILGVVVLIVQVLAPFLLLILLRKQKKYICTKCYKQFLREKKNPKICPNCGGEVIEMDGRAQKF